jgi:hypothetical protein
MVEKTEFGDHAGLRQDAEILACLDKQRNGKSPEIEIR